MQKPKGSLPMLARKLEDEHAKSTRKMQHRCQIYKKVESDVSSGVLHFANGKSMS